MKIITGWLNDIGQICLMHRENGVKKIVTGNYQWYFYILNNDENSKLMIQCRLKTAVVGQYIKIFTDWNNRKNLLYELDKRKIQTYEADLNPVDLFLLDKKIELEENFKILYIDIETDDRAKKIVVGKEQILSFAWYDNEGNNGWLCEDSEDIFLKQIIDIISQYDVIVGWYSSEFDYPYIQMRCANHGIRFNWDTIIHIDLCKRFKKLASYRIDLPNFKLGTVAKFFTGEEKYEYPGSTWEAYKNDRQKLKRYNMRDAELLYLLDKSTSAIKLMILEAKWCNAFLKEFWVGKLLDMFILKNAHKRGIHFISKPNVDKNYRPEYLGGLVLTPIAGLYNNVHMFDFRMTYPNIIRSFNISTESLRLTEDKSYIKSPHAGVYFDKKPNLVSEILVDLMNKRYEYEAEMKKYEFKSKEYESFRICQDTIKEICNSIYGISGDPKSRYYHTAVAASITETGRVCLKIAAFLFKDYGYKVLQGDTDSLYVVDEIKDRKEDVSEILKKVNDRLTKTLIANFNIDKSTIVLADKGVYSRALLVRKKGYAGLVNGKTDILGLEAIKADTVGFAKEMQKELIENLLRNNYNLDYYINFMNEKKNELYNTQLPLEKVIIRQTITKPPEEYKSKLAHVVIAKKMIEMGQLCYAGTSIEYIIKTYKPESTPILPSEYTGEFDRDYYWENKIGPLCQRVLEVVFPSYDWNQIYTIHEKKSRKKSTKNEDKSAILL